jgi:hypothetical protein
MAMTRLSHIWRGPRFVGFCGRRTEEVRLTVIEWDRTHAAERPAAPLRGHYVVPELKVQVLMFWMAVDPPVPPVKPT